MSMSDDDDDDDDDEDEDEERQALTAAVLFGVAAAAQLASVLPAGVRFLAIPGVALPQLAIILPAAGFAIALLRGFRPRVGMIAFALLWSGLSIWVVLSLRRFAAEMAAAASHPLAPWFMPLVVARAIAFAAATLVLLTGRPSRTRRRAGAALAFVFGALFVAERAYQLFG
jgi:hypothetical protein